MKQWIFCLAAMLVLYCDAVAAHEESGYAQNIKLFRPMAEQGNAVAQYNLGVMYASGQGVKRDYQQAVKWYRLAAAQGHTLAQSNLGMMYGKGQGVTQNHVRAHMWSNLAAAKGNSSAQKNRDRLARKMTAAQISEARKLAGECEGRNYKNCD